MNTISTPEGPNTKNKKQNKFQPPKGPNEKNVHRTLTKKINIKLIYFCVVYTQKNFLQLHWALITKNNGINQA